MTAAQQGKTPLHPALSAANALVLLLASGSIFLSSCGAYFLLYSQSYPVARIVALVAGAIGVVLFSAGSTGMLDHLRSRRHSRHIDRPRRPSEP